MPTEPVEERSEEDLRVEESRRLVEQRLAELRSAAHADLGLVPRSGGWVLPVVGFAVGFGLAVRAFRRRRRLQRG
ncbi:MAG TPA: hypothetical protein VN811_04780 [Thermoanaerobaculia bacterium]|nr:hypothetical protein [Thermoanaerobaculia bacterium]HXT50332.1 hypothetical protein [Thermoanaerobaculia bacterium]